MSITSNKNFIELYYKLMEDEVIAAKKESLNFLVEGYDLPDPFSPHLTDDDKQKIIEKAKSDFWYFMKEIVRVPVVGSRDGVPAKINKTNLAVLMGLLEKKNIYSNNPRQLYGTMTRIIYTNWLIIKHGDSLFGKIAIYSRKNEENTYFINKVQLLNDMLPSYIKRNYRDIAPVFRQVTPRKLDNFIELDLKDTNHPWSGLLIINDLEFCDRLLKLFLEIEVKMYRGDIQVTGNSVIGKEKTHGRYIGDKIVERSLRWDSEYFVNERLRDVIKTNMVYVKYDYDELVENPSEWFNYTSRMLSNDQDIINREILLKRN